MKISEVSKKLKIPTSTIRYYEKRGIIFSNRNENGYRDYNANALEMIQLVLLAKDLGFTLKEIKSFAISLRGNDLQKKTVTSHIERKIKEFDEKIFQLKDFQKKLKAALKNPCDFVVSE